MINWSCEITNSTAGRSDFIRVLVDGVTTIAEQNRYKGQSYPNDWGGQSGVKQMTFTAEQHTVKMQFKAEGNEFYIRRARISMLRVG